MKGLPKRFETAADIRNCFALVQSGDIVAKDMLEAMEGLENQQYIICPIKSISNKTITVGYCAEAHVDAVVAVGNKTATIVTVEHILGETQEGQERQYETTEITLSAKVTGDVAKIPSGHDIYAYLGMTKAEFDEIKAQLQ